jgi:hypothetical protein
MKVVNDYRCPLGHENEHFVDNQVTHVTCLTCGNEATKMRSVPNFQLPGNDAAGFPTAHSKWSKKREEKMAHERSQGHTPFGEPSS